VKLFQSFIHNVIIHPLFIPAEIAECFGCLLPMSIVDTLHKLTGPEPPFESFSGWVVNVSPDIEGDLHKLRVENEDLKVKLRVSEEERHAANVDCALAKEQLRISLDKLARIVTGVNHGPS
jgi:hypothetical protein